MSTDIHPRYIGTRSTATEQPHPRVLIVEHEANAGAGRVGVRLERAGMTTITVGPESDIHTVPTEASDFDGVIVLGGTPGPTDDEVAPWLPRVRELIRWCLDRSHPYLGVCLGGQMLAHVGGGEVGNVRNGPEVGVCDITMNATSSDDRIFGDVGARVRSVQWHWLEIHSAPPDAVVLASSDRCPVQAFRLGEMAWGTQFHLEADSDTVRGWARDDRDDLKEIGLTAAGLIEETTLADLELDSTWGQTIDRWIDVVRAYSAPGFTSEKTEHR